MRERGPEPSSPIARHASTPRELQERVAAERSGKPHLLYRDADGRQVIHFLPDDEATVTLGRSEDRDIDFTWDAEVSRLHAKLEAVGHEWTIVDDGLSRNGTFVNRDRIHGQRRLGDADTIVVGNTAVVFRCPIRSAGRTTTAARGATIRASVTERDRNVLIALCRPLKDAGQTLPATNQAIADELCLTVPAVKKRLGGLFVRFGLDDLPQAQKRSRLAVVAFENGIVTVHDL